MPNWCLNILTLKSTNNYLDRFYEDNYLNKEYPLSFNKLMPNMEWGCKWDASNIDVSRQDNELVYQFDTPWCPPYDWIEFISKKYLDIRIEYEGEEEGENFYTKAVYENGVLIEEETKEYDEFYYEENNGQEYVDKAYEYLKDNEKWKEYIEDNDDIDLDDFLTNNNDIEYYDELEDISTEISNYSGYFIKKLLEKND